MKAGREDIMKRSWIVALALFIGAVSGAVAMQQFPRANAQESPEESPGAAEGKELNDPYVVLGVSSWWNARNEEPPKTLPKILNEWWQKGYELSLFTPNGEIVLKRRQ